MDEWTYGLLLRIKYFGPESIMARKYVSDGKPFLSKGKIFFNTSPMTAGWLLRRWETKKVALYIRSQLSSQYQEVPRDVKLWGM